MTLSGTILLEPFVGTPVRVHFRHELELFSLRFFLGGSLAYFGLLLESLLAILHLLLEELHLKLLSFLYLLVLLFDELLAEHLIVLLDEGGVL
jgi:hypothetical protein